jgi:hypothetical protein
MEASMTDEPRRDAREPESERSEAEELLRPFLPKSFGLPGAVFLSWMIAGGLLAGGFLVAYGTMTEQISGRALLHTAGGLYIAGAILGGVLGGALGMFGRPQRMEARSAFRDQMVALLYSLPVLFIAFVVTGWIAMTVVAIHMGEVLPLVGVSAAYLIAFLAVGMAIRFGAFGARRAVERVEEEIEEHRGGKEED